MRRKIILASSLLLLLAGCAALEQSQATVGNGEIKNPSLGFSGFAYQIPEGFELYDPATEQPAERTPLQQMAIRIYNTNKAYHPSGNETFYESFLMFSETAAFMLVTVEHDRLAEILEPWEDAGLQRQLLPLYNTSDFLRTVLGRGRLDTLMTSGNAYEKKGWYYAKPKRGSMEFSYSSCQVSGPNRDRYILMGFSLPEHKHILSLQMKEMVKGFQF